MIFRLLHFSDIHLSPLPRPAWWQLVGKRITGYLNWKFNRQPNREKNTLAILMADGKNQNPDHIIISGDITNLSLEEEFLQAQLWLKNLGTEKNISLVPGNHDTYVIGALKKFCNFFTPWITEDGERNNFFFPYMHIRKNIALIGVSSCIPTPPFFSIGYFGYLQAQRLALFLSVAKRKKLFRIIVIHHPPIARSTSWNKQLFGVKRFQKTIFLYGAELVLHGHTHRPSLAFIEGKKKDIPCIGVSSASQDFGTYLPPACYNIFTIETIEKKECRSWSCILTRRSIIDSYGSIATTQTKILQP